VPCYYAYKPSARRGYGFAQIDPAFAFGFGLSYTQFKCSTPRLGHARIRANETTTLELDVSNTGPRDGAEVVQLYVTDEVSLITRPVKELRDFKKVWLKAGETQTVRFTIGPRQLEFCDQSYQRVVDPGAFTLRVGTSSRDCDLQAVPLEVAAR